MVITGHLDGSIYIWMNMDENEPRKVDLGEENREKSEAG